MDSATWEIFDIMGTAAFAVSGAVLAIEERMDLFGVIVLALLTAVGGGVVRDVLVGITPPMTLCNIMDFMLAIVTALLVAWGCSIRFISDHSRQCIAFIYNLCDTIGLASFTITGLIIGIDCAVGNPYVLPPLLGVVTAVGGGILRDLMAQRMPVVLYKGIYATASLAGALAAVLLYPYIGLLPMAWLCFAVVISLRAGALYFGWHLFHPQPERKR